MKVDATPCSLCKWWTDAPHVGEDGRAWARCKLTGCLVDAEFWCKHGEREAEQRT